MVKGVFLTSNEFDDISIELLKISNQVNTILSYGNLSITQLEALKAINSHVAHLFDCFNIGWNNFKE